MAASPLIKPHAPLSGQHRERFETATASMGQTQVNLDRALQVAASLEDDELVRF